MVSNQIYHSFKSVENDSSISKQQFAVCIGRRIKLQYHRQTMHNVHYVHTFIITNIISYEFSRLHNCCPIGSNLFAHVPLKRSQKCHLSSSRPLAQLHALRVPIKKLLQKCHVEEVLKTTLIRLRNAFQLFFIDVINVRSRRTTVALSTLLCL